MNRINPRTWGSLSWLLPWLVASVLGAVFIAYLAIERHRALFETDARIVHRLLSQQVVQHDAILATLALLQAGKVRQTGIGTEAELPQEAAPEQRLTTLYPHILAVQRREKGMAWPDNALTQAEATSRQSRLATLASMDVKAGQYRLVLAADPMSYSLTIDMRRMVPWGDWPMQPETSPVSVALEYQRQSFVLQGSQSAIDNKQLGWQFDFRKRLAADSQPFYVFAKQTFGWAQLPWLLMLLWVLVVSAVLYTASLLVGQLAARRRAEELLRLGQVARLNTLGELAAGVAHELNQPLTAVLANTQAAQRLLADEPPDVVTAQQAMAQAAAQARRAAEVVGRLRRVVEQPEASASVQNVRLDDAVRRALYLLEPDIQRRGVQVQVQATSSVLVHADPVALDQIIHNLLMNALQALEKIDKSPRNLRLTITHHGQFMVADNGPGIPPEVLPHLFEPFFSTREGGLGLGLTLCETLANGMGGQLSARNLAEGGAEFILALPLVNDNNSTGSTLHA